MRWVNRVLSNVRLSLDGIFPAFRFATYAHRYLAKAAWSFNRRFDAALLAGVSSALLSLAHAAFARHVRHPLPTELQRESGSFLTVSRNGGLFKVSQILENCSLV